MSLIFEKQIKITEQYIDANNHVNNVQYVKWVEEKQPFYPFLFVRNPKHRVRP